MAATVKLTVLLPVRLLPPLTVIQPPALLTTVQVQPLVVVTRVLPDPPAVATLKEVGDRLKLQDAACDTVSV